MIRRMREVGWLVVAGLAGSLGCSGGGAPGSTDDAGPTDALPSFDAEPWPALQLDVQVQDGWIDVSGRDPGAPGACTWYPFLRSGCEELTDVATCGGGLPGPWVNEVQLRDGATVIASHAITAGELWMGTRFSAAEIGGHAGLRVAVIARDGQRADVAIPAIAPPRPTVDQVAVVGSTLHVAWHADPVEASTVVAGHTWLTGYRCHVDAPTRAVDLPWMWEPAQARSYTVTTYAPAPPVATPLGEVRVWIGASATGPIPAP